MTWQKYFFTITLGLFFIGQGIFIIPNLAKASDAPADLLVDSISFSPTEPNAKDNVTVTVSIKNAGTTNLVDFTGIKSIQYNLPDFTTTNNVLNTISRNPTASAPIKPGESFTYTIKGYFTKSGSKTMSFMIDANYSIEESNESNNYKTQEVTVKLSTAEQTQMDLIAKNITVSVYRPLVGEKVTINVQGFLSSTSTLAAIGKPSYSFAGFTLINDVTKTVVPYPTENNPWSMLQNFEYTALGYFTSEGTKSLSFTVNPPSGYTDYNTGNNTATTTVTVDPILDLSLESMKVEKSTTTDSLVNLTANIKNKGNAFTSPFSVKVLLNDTFINNYSYSNGLKNGETKTHNSTISLAQFKTGTNAIRVELSEISGKEVNLNNNSSTANFITTSTPAVVTQPETETESESTSTPKTDTSISSWTTLEKSLVSTIDQNLTQRLKGYILLQVQANGQAWYLDPVTGQKYYLKDGPTAYEALRKFGLGITDTDLAKIPVGIEDRFFDTDTDGDGLNDTLEESLGTDLNKPDTDGDGYTDKAEIQSNYNPLGTGTKTIDANLTNRLKGKIVLQVQSLGQAWYINPKDGKRYYLKDGQAAYEIMRFLSLGITNTDLRKISVGEL
ncbi:MAG: CARDB domain-containing protein [Candidatus Buchananbacteria bacterium]